MNCRLCTGTCLLLLGELTRAAGAGSVPNPKVIGPIPATAKPGDPSRDYPFFSTTADLASYGYVEQEFFIEGAANRYITPALATGSIIDGGHPYRTRMVVRRPAAAGKFNGTVLLEWQNAAAGHDLDALWALLHDHLMRRGYAWIGVSVSQAGIHQSGVGLKAWSPKRYMTLDVTRDGAILDDALSYDIFSQSARAVRSPEGADPVGGLHVERIIAAGASGPANRLVTYHSSIHPTAGVLDAFLLAGGGGRLRSDLDVKVFQLLTETEVARGVIRQSNSDRFRRWEIAGAAHLGFHLSQELAQLRTRDGITPPTAACDLPPFSRVPQMFAANAAIDHLVRWVRENIQPPVAPEIRVTTASLPAIARDGFGNALGGVRLPQHAVPTAANTGVNSGPGFCRLYGSFQPFDNGTLAALYPDQKTYVRQVIQAALDDVAAGFMLPPDAMTTILDAMQSRVGRHIARPEPSKFQERR